MPNKGVCEIIVIVVNFVVVVVQWLLVVVVWVMVGVLALEKLENIDPVLGNGLKIIKYWLLEKTMMHCVSTYYKCG